MQSLLTLAIEYKYFNLHKYNLDRFPLYVWLLFKSFVKLVLLEGIRNKVKWVYSLLEETVAKTYTEEEKNQIYYLLGIFFSDPLKSNFFLNSKLLLCPTLSHGNTPLLMSIINKNIYYTNYLLDNGYDVNNNNNWNGDNCLHLACAQPVHIVYELVKRIININPNLINMKNSNKDTPLHIAISHINNNINNNNNNNSNNNNSEYSIVILLIEKLCDVGVYNLNGKQPFQCFKYDKYKANFLRTVTFSIDSLRHNNYTLWFNLVAINDIPNFEDIIKNYVKEYNELVDAKDMAGLLIII